ncbi:MAG: YolD-like family protein [Lachnospiraceae bacterium]|nr:YolD-like family protein [Lachnospiraceae bacterium]
MYNQNNDIKSYEDIINLPHPTSKKHKSMSIHDRAAQFSPFAALSGYEEMVSEAGRLTKEKKELSDSEKAILDRKINLLKEIINSKNTPEVTVTYFLPDPLKSGGSYETFTGKIKKIDDIKRTVNFFDNKIYFDDIIDISGEDVDVIDEWTT